MDIESNSIDHRLLSVLAAARYLGVSRKTLYRWEQIGTLLPAVRTLGGHRRYSMTTLHHFLNGKRMAGTSSEYSSVPGEGDATIHAAIYARVSSSEQKRQGDLQRQIEVLTEYCAQKNYQLVGIYQDVGSGLNDSRRGLLSMLHACAKGKIGVIVATYPDRLARFSLQIIKEVLQICKVKLDLMYPTVIQGSDHDQMISDLTAILYSFTSKMYASRRKKKQPQDPSHR